MRRHSCPLQARSLLPFTASALLGAVLAAQQGAPSPTPTPVPTPVPATAKVAWKHTPKGAAIEELVTDGKALFVLDRSGFVQALEPAAGKVLWTSTEPMQLRLGYGLAVGVVGDVPAVLVGFDQGLVALRRDTGARLWRTPVDGGLAGPVCSERAAFAGGGDGRIHAFELGTGKELWTADCMEDRPADPPGFHGADARLSGQAARMGPASTDGRRVFVPIFDQCRAVAVDAVTGKRLWSFQAQGWTYGRVAIGEHNVFVVSQDRRAYGVDKELGKESYRVETTDRNEAPFAVDGRFACFGSCDGNLVAVDEVVGRVLWRFAIEPDARGITPIYGAPLLQGDTVLLAAMPGVVYAVDRQKGTRRWQLRPSPGSELIGDVLAIGPRLFVTTRQDGKNGESGVFAIDPP